MNGGVSTFLQGLAEKGPHPVLGRSRGTVRFDLVGGDGMTECWLVALDQGQVAVSQGTGPADCTMRMQESLFLGLMAGRENGMAGVLRGEIECFGDVELMYAVQRIFPGPVQTGAR